MKNKFKTPHAVSLALIAGTAALTAALFARLPARMPVHFDLHGTADGWLPRSSGAWQLPSLAFGIWVLLWVGPRLGWSKARARRRASSSALVATLIVAFLCALQCVVLYAALVKPPSVATVRIPGIVIKQTASS